jgi:hypothetical protein
MIGRDRALRSLVCASVRAMPSAFASCSTT